MKRKAANPRRTHLRLTDETVFSMIQERAYNIYCQRGDTPGDHLSDWLSAEQQVSQELNRTSRAAASQPRSTTSRGIPRRAARA